MPAGIDQLVTDMDRHGLTTRQFEHTFVRLERITVLQADGLVDEDLRRTDARTAVRVVSPLGGAAGAPASGLVAHRVELTQAPGLA
jgi:hypothetical protein